jgi:hypothetical protein
MLKKNYNPNITVFSATAGCLLFTYCISVSFLASTLGMNGLLV